MEADLTLKKAVTLVQQSETVTTQQPAVRGELSQPTGIEVVKSQWFTKSKEQISQTKFNTPTRDMNV